MGRKDGLRGQLIAGLAAFEAGNGSLPGIGTDGARETFVAQLVDSVRRIQFVHTIRKRQLSTLRGDPASEMFDPIRAAVLCHQAGNLDEAFWLVFLSVHFGKHLRRGWQLCRAVYGALGQGMRWDWARTSADPDAFCQWLAASEAELRAVRGFGNHRKYLSLDAYSTAGTGGAFRTYINWVGTARGHAGLLKETQDRVGNNPGALFDDLFVSMRRVASFGRMARFDYLTMVGKLGLAPIEPSRPYIQNSTGPLAGARLLYGDSSLSAYDLDQKLTRLGNVLGVGMQVMEDAVCNWQKSPSTYVGFRG